MEECVTAVPNQTAHHPSPMSAPSVLVVDDSPPTAKALARVLASAGYETTVAHSGSEALDYAKSIDFAAAVVDIHLGDISGLVVAQKLRERIGPSGTIIILSGDTSLETLNSLPHVGATYFFSKPVSATTLLERLKEWVPVAAAVE
jgi:DNA-binding response OmpR family regulator